VLNCVLCSRRGPHPFIVMILSNSFNLLLLRGKQLIGSIREHNNSTDVYVIAFKTRERSADE